MSSMTGFAGNAPTGGRQVGKIGGYKQFQMPQFTPDQMQLFQQMFSHVGPDSYLSRLASGDQAMFNEMEAPAMRQFQGLQGQIGSRFAGMGLGATKSSGFRNTLNQASSDFAQDLASRRQGLQQQAVRDLMGLSGQLLGQRPYESTLLQEEMPFWKQLSLGLTGGVGQGLGSLGGMWGAKKLGLF